MSEISFDISWLSLYLKPIERNGTHSFVKPCLEKERRKDDEKVRDFDDFGFYL